jgi:hypothetical protein
MPSKKQIYLVVGEVLLKKKFAVEILAESADEAKATAIASKGSAAESVAIEYVFAKNQKRRY